MKKWPIIIPSLAVISTTPIISLTSCSIEQYIVSEEEFEKAIKMTGVTYLQVFYKSARIKSNANSNEEKDHGCIKTSSTVCYCLSDVVGSFEEYYETKINNQYKQYWRGSKEEHQWTIKDDTTGTNFITAEYFGEHALYLTYKGVVELGAVAWFNPDEKCYLMEWTSENNASCYNKYYFINKRLIKILSSDGTWLSTYNFTYNEETPRIPDKPTSLEADPMEEWKVA